MEKITKSENILSKNLLESLGGFWNKKIFGVKIKSFLFFIPIIIFLILVSFITPENIIQNIGVENIYILMFFIALIGGLSFFSSIPYPIFLITFAIGGGNSLILAIVTALGVVLGDSISYMIGRKSQRIIEGKAKKVFNFILSFYDSKQNILPLMFFIYGAISPFPNDLITLSGGIKKYPYFKMIIPLSLGNFIFCFILASFADYFSKFFGLD